MTAEDVTCKTRCLMFVLPSLLGKLAGGTAGSKRSCPLSWDLTAGQQAPETRSREDAATGKQGFCLSSASHHWADF